MANFFVAGDEFKNDIIKITGEEKDHMIKVLRMGVGDSLTLFDGVGNCAEAVISEIQKAYALASVTGRGVAETEPKLKITVFQGIPKAAKLDYIVQKATEIGVVRVVPVETARCVAKIDKKAKIERLSKIALEAAKQCGRAVVPEVSEPMSFKDALAEAKKCDSIVIPYECEKESRLSAATLKGANTLAIFIGPEGGFEESEVAEAEAVGATRVTLGKRILRTETAGLVAAAICLYLNSDI